MTVNHLALLPDGNRRWAKQNKTTVRDGHHEGLARLAPKIINQCFKTGIHTVTIFPFSTENWSRSKKELTGLMTVIDEMLEALVPVVKLHRARVIHLGRQDRLPAAIINKLKKMQLESRLFEEHTLNLAIDYGGIDEILRGVKKLMSAGYSLRKIGKSGLGPWLDTAGQPFPNPDLIIRTAEKRLSGFMIYQSAYSEIYFSKKLWPDFKNKDLQAALADYAKRQRKFGK